MKPFNAWRRFLSNVRAAQSPAERFLVDLSRGEQPHWTPEALEMLEVHRADLTRQSKACSARLAVVGAQRPVWPHWTPEMLEMLEGTHVPISPANRRPQCEPQVAGAPHWPCAWSCCWLVYPSGGMDAGAITSRRRPIRHRRPVGRYDRMEKRHAAIPGWIPAYGTRIGCCDAAGRCRMIRRV